MALNIADLVGGFAERAGEELIGYGVGTALSRGLEPEATRLAQAVWMTNPDKALEPPDAADIVAEQLQGEAWGASEAAAYGVSPERFSALAEHARTGPSFGDLLTLWRRGAIGDAELVAGLKKLKLGTQWHAPLSTLKETPLLPEQIATAVQRGVMKNPGLLPVSPPSEGGNVPPMPQVALDPVEEAAWSGHSAERIAAITRIAGLPPAPGELLQLVNRGHITETDFYRGVAEGNTRNEWGPFLLQLRKHVIPPTQYAELALRGWIDEQEMVAGASLSGVAPTDAQLLHDLHGRPLPVHQVQTGLARGGTFGAAIADIPADFLASVRQSNLRPEWYGLAYANRHTLPSAFVVRQLLKDGAITPARAEELFTQSGWPPELAAEVAKGSTATATAAPSKHLTKAQTQLWNTVHKSYLADETTVADATAELAALGVPQAERPAVLALWDRERAIVRKTLTPAQIKKAVKGGTFTAGEATARLEQLGYSPADAATFLAE